MKPRIILRLPVHAAVTRADAQPETKLERAARIYGRPFTTDGKTTKGITFWNAERIAELSQANEALRKARG